MKGGGADPRRQFREIFGERVPPSQPGNFTGKTGAAPDSRRGHPEFRQFSGRSGRNPPVTDRSRPVYIPANSLSRCGPAPSGRGDQRHRQVIGKPAPVGGVITPGLGD